MRQGCVLSAVLFNLVLDWVMWCATGDQPKGIRWTLFDMLENLDFTDDIALRLTYINTRCWCKRRHTVSASLVNRLDCKSASKKRRSWPWTWMLQHQSYLITRPFPAQRPSPIWAASSDRMEVPTKAFKADWAKPGAPLGVWMQSGGHHSTASRLRWSCAGVWIRVLWMTKHDLAKLSSFRTSLRKMQCIFWPWTLTTAVSVCGKRFRFPWLSKKWKLWRKSQSTNKLMQQRTNS